MNLERNDDMKMNKGIMDSDFSSRLINKAELDTFNYLIRLIWNPMT